MQTINLVEYAKRFFADWKHASKGILVLCPFHDDKIPSLYITEDYAYCFACGKGWQPQTFIQKLEKKPINFICPPKPQKKKIPICPPENLVIQAHEHLMNMPQKLALLEQRGLTLSIIKTFQIGYVVPPVKNCTLPRFSFPAWGIDGKLKTITYRQDHTLKYPNLDNENKKYLHHPNTEVIPYNIHNIHSYSWLVYTGGQIDALSLLQYNIPAIGAPGEGIFKSEWINYFQNKKVLIWLDADEAGQKGAQKIHKLLNNSIIVNWPPEVPEKYDVNEAIRDPLFGIKEIRRILHSYYTRFR